MSEQTSLLNANNLTCIREDRILFESLSFRLNAGEILQIEGPNGAGKTSLLRILAGLSSPYEGHVVFQEKNIQSNKEDYLENLTYLGHLSGIKAEMTAQENLEFYLSMQGESPHLAEETLSEVNLLGFEDTLASHLSAGQHRRIALARLWRSQDPIWILDEPFTAIDKQGVHNLEVLFLNHIKKGGGIILTTHQDLSSIALKVRKITLDYRFF